MSSTIKFLLVENDWMEMYLQEAKQRKEQYARSTMAEMKKFILVELSTLETTMWKLYDKFFIVHKEVVHLYGFQQGCMKISQNIKNIHVAIAHV